MRDEEIKKQNAQKLINPLRIRHVHAIYIPISLNQPALVAHLYVNTHFRLLLCLNLEVSYVEFHVKMIDRKLVLSRVILEDAGEEGLCEVEPAEPIHIRLALVQPPLQKGQSGEKIIDV